ncbi:MAG: putative lipid II flippase FtsW [Candidatus Brocadiaceae bacterium]
MMKVKSWHFLIYIVVALLGFSIVTVYSTDTAAFSANSGVHQSISLQFIKHLLWVFLGSGLMVAMAKIDYHHLQKLSIPILVVSLVTLVLVLIPGVGTVTNGARRWIRLGSIMGVQPSEFAKLAVIIFISAYITKNQNRMSEFKRGFLLPLGIAAGTSALIIKEPDFGTSALIIAISVIMLIIGGIRIRYIFSTLLAALPLMYEIVFGSSYRLRRLLAFLNPWADPSGAGYHIIQSWIALGSGGLTGLGIGESKQKLFFLPESNSDFIFTIIGEEFGYLGVVTIICLFLLLLWQGLRIVHATKDLFGFFLGLGITLMFGLQAIINIAVVSGALPTKGIPLPFVSAGGSSLLLSMTGIGILINIARLSETLKTENEVHIDAKELCNNIAYEQAPVKLWHKIAHKIAGFSW